MFDNGWYGITDGDARAYYLYSRHYSAHQYRDNRRDLDRRIVGPGDRLVLMTPDCLALFVWKVFDDPSGQQGVYCSVFRNEGPQLSSELIRQAERIAWRKWPGERLYTYVDPKKVKTGKPKSGKPNPGKCFIKAGWHMLVDEASNPVYTQSGKLIFEKYPEAK